MDGQCLKYSEQNHGVLRDKNLPIRSNPSAQWLAVGELDAVRVIRSLSLVGIDGRHPLARPKDASQRGRKLRRGMGGS